MTQKHWTRRDPSGYDASKSGEATSSAPPTVSSRRDTRSSSGSQDSTEEVLPVPTTVLTRLDAQSSDNSKDLLFGATLAPGAPVQYYDIRHSILTFNQFTIDDAWHLGNLLRKPLVDMVQSGGYPAVVSIFTARGCQPIFECVTGLCITRRTVVWAEEKKKEVAAFARRMFRLSIPFVGEETRFNRIIQIMNRGQYSHYMMDSAGVVPIQIEGIAGIKAIVMVTGLGGENARQFIVNVIKRNWTPAPAPVAN